MKLAFLHLSDIHFESEADWIISKANLIASAALSSIFNQTIECFFVVVSGDIANKGSKPQYIMAKHFFEKIRAKITKERNTPLHFIFVPGNHDCDLSQPEQLELRSLSIEKILKEQDQVTRGNQLYLECLKVQNQFFKFANLVEPKLGYPKKPEVFYRFTIPIAGKKIIFNCFNTAWLTQKRETQGLLTMPRQLFPECESSVDDSAVSVSLYHHPENWLSADRANDFRQILRNCSDIIITGHEHERDIHTQHYPETGEHIQIHRAGALQDRDRPYTSNFNVLLLDLENFQQKLITFQWKESLYKVKGEPDWIEFRRNEKLNAKFTLNWEFENTLRSLETLPIYAHGLNLQLEDFFVIPRLQIYSLENIINGKPGTASIESKDFLRFITDEKKVVLYGETLQGKTITARFLFLKLRSQGIVPVMVDGENLNEKNLEQSINKCLKEHYKGDSIEAFRGLSKSGRALIIDNFGQGGLNQVQLQKLLIRVAQDFDYVIAIAHTNLRIQQFIENENHEVRFSDYAHCELKPFNRSQRNKLIKNWVRRTDASASSDTILRAMSQHEQAVETACSAGIIAPYPAYILGVLTLSQSVSKTDPTKYGTIGYLYESLITSRFSIFDEKDIDLQQTYILLGEMAFNSFRNERLDISIEETDEIIKRYQSEYLLSVYTPRFIDQIIETGIILRNKGRLEFSSPQLRDFFVADYYSRALSDKDTQGEAHEQIDSIIRTVTYESHTRILLFLVFKAADKPRFIEQILNVSRQIFAEFTPTDLEEDVAFLNSLENTEFPKPKLIEECSVWDRHKLVNGSDDESEDENPSLFKNRDKFLVEYREDLDEFIKAAIALKMIEVLGQLARSFASALKGDTKISIIEETIELGLRFLKSLFRFRITEIEDLRRIVADLIKHQHEDLNENELIDRADKILLFMYFGGTVGVIRKISSSIGHEDLRGSFDKFFAMHRSSLSYRIIEAAFRLDHYPDPLIDRIVKLGEELETKNKFVWDVLTQFVAQHLNLNSASNAPQRQRLIEKFKLGSDSSFLVNSELSERQYLPRARQKFLPPPKTFKEKKK